MRPYSRLAERSLCTEHAASSARLANGITYAHDKNEQFLQLLASAVGASCEQGRLKASLLNRARPKWSGIVPTICIRPSDLCSGRPTGWEVGSTRPSVQSVGRLLARSIRFKAPSPSVGRVRNTDRSDGRSESGGCLVRSGLVGSDMPASHPID